MSSPNSPREKALAYLRRATHVGSVVERSDGESSYHEVAQNRASDLDRAHFAAHPGVEFYMRAPVPHEFCLALRATGAMPVNYCAEARAARVTEFTEGGRMRIAVDALAYPEELVR